MITLITNNGCKSQATFRFGVQTPTASASVTVGDTMSYSLHYIGVLVSITIKNPDNNNINLIGELDRHCEGSYVSVVHQSDDVSVSIYKDGEH